MKTIIADEQHKLFITEFQELMKKHLANVPSHHILAVVSNIVGRVIAVQDQRMMTPDRAMQLVRENIERGNQQALEQLNALDLSEVKPT